MIDLSLILSPFKLKTKKKELYTSTNEDWYKITPQDCFDIFYTEYDYRPRILRKEVENFLYDNFDAFDFSITRVPFGYYNQVTEIRFRNEEDYMAFKLKWL